MTPELAPLEPIFLRWSVATGRPWPREPFLRAKFRALWAALKTEAIFAEIIARATIIEMLQGELAELLIDHARWTDVAAAYGDLADRLRDKSPWFKP